MHPMHYQLELSGTTATLYVAGSLDLVSAPALVAVCGSLPAHVRTLRLDLRALGSMSADATGAVRLLLRCWHETRRGEYRLTTSYLVATCTEVRTHRRLVGRAQAGYSVGEAVMAT